MSHETFLKGRVTLCCGDSWHFLRDQPDNRYDSIVTDPPYALVSIQKRFANSPRSERTENTENPYGRTGRGFMGQKWDNGSTAHAVEFWQECLRVLKPGGHVVAFSGTRTYHRMACAIEDAGFEIRDMIGYLYGSGFPKSHNISKNIGLCLCEALPERDLRSVRRANVSQALHAGDECSEILLSGVSQQSPHRAMFHQDAEEGHAGREKPSMEGRRHLSESPRQLRERPLCSLPAGIDLDGENGRLRNGASASNGAVGSPVVDADGMRPSLGSQATEQRSGKSGTVAGQPEPQVSGAWDRCRGCGKPLVPDGLGTALKPAQEPICLARKPLSEKTVAQNVLAHGTGAINIDGCRVGTEEDTSRVLQDIRGGNFAGGNGKGRLDRVGGGHDAGRWPANIIHDGSEEVVAAFPQSDIGGGPRGAIQTEGSVWGIGAERSSTPGGATYGDNGSAARFFYTAKADADDRLGSKHPTVKPVDLMQWLVRLVTPKNGLVLDPFGGTGTTAEACYREGMRCMIIEREAEYQADIRRRMALCDAGPDERKRESIKAKVGDLPFEENSLFGWSPK